MSLPRHHVRRFTVWLILALLFIGLDAQGRAGRQQRRPFHVCRQAPVIIEVFEQRSGVGVDLDLFVVVKREDAGRHAMCLVGDV